MAVLTEVPGALRFFDSIVVAGAIACVIDSLDGTLDTLAVCVLELTAPFVGFFALLSIASFFCVGWIFDFDSEF